MPRDTLVHEIHAEQSKGPKHLKGFWGHCNWYDLLISLGSYQGCNLLLPGVGLSLDYGPGTVVGLSGMALQHEVTQFEGERVSFAHFMRDTVHEWATVPGESWMKTNYYE